MQTAIQALPGSGDCESPPQTDARPPLAVHTSAPRPALTLSELLDLYFAQFTGRDQSKLNRLELWRARLGARDFATITDDDVFAEIERIAAAPARIWAGRDADRQPVFRVRGKRTPATVNRYQAALSAVFTWAIRNRRAPRGWINPCHQLGRKREAAGVVRFLSAEECDRLLGACKASKWPMLYVLVLMAITTGARRSELAGLHWRDLDLDRAVASVGRTKNGDPKTLPLVPAVVEELRAQRKRAGDGGLVFASKRNPREAFKFQERWRTALKSAKVRGFRFHDLRHTCASYLAQNGASLLEIADVLGQRHLAMVKRYAHLTINSKAALVNRVLGEIK